jgi:hypothetical protein
VTSVAPSGHPVLSAIGNVLSDRLEWDGEALP